VKTGRKPLETAVSQFDQTLQMQGASSIATGHEKKAGKGSTPAATKPRNGKAKPKPRSSRVSRKQSGRLLRPKPKKNILSAAELESKFDLKKVSFGNPSPSEAKTETPPASAPVDTTEQPSETDARDPINDKRETESTDHGPADETEADTENVNDTELKADSTPAASGKEGADTALPPENESKVTNPRERDTVSGENPAAGTVETDPISKPNASGEQVSIGGENPPVETVETDPISKPYEPDEQPANPDELAMEDIDQRVAEFEKDLAMQCPMCRASQFVAETTALGKTFYKCNRKNCNFISWGMPHHKNCPQCNNSFLIETTDRAGARLLKCPRATCSYRQPFPEDSNDEAVKKSRKKVVRRRVVRRKR
jgi:hypothetical protein